MSSQERLVSVWTVFRRTVCKPSTGEILNACVGDVFSHNNNSAHPRTCSDGPPCACLLCVTQEGRHLHLRHLQQQQLHAETTAAHCCLSTAVAVVQWLGSTVLHQQQQQQQQYLQKKLLFTEN